jgi:hypothetical protein
MYKKLVGVIIASCMFLFVTAQQNKAAIAPFKIEQANGKFYTYKELKKNMPAVLVYFSPTCEHCKVFVKELLW